MYITVLVKTIIFALLLILSFSCDAVNTEQKNLELLLPKSFEQIYLAKFGLDFPKTLDILNRCIQYNDTQCLKAYNEVMEGKKTLQSISSSHVLETTLNIIEKACLSKDENLANFTCYGGIISLYFYNSPEQDAKILQRIKIYPKKIQNMIFDNEFHWFYNRPNKDVWISAVSTMDVDWKNDTYKQYILSLFRKNIEEAKGETWVSK
ncbi:hypothetical protein DDY07_14825 [Methylomonas sp. ZR1]|nr:hypothetical protein [Methylomonas sp. ZR1]